jgi:hypothetical protein
MLNRIRDALAWFLPRCGHKRRTWPRSTVNRRPVPTYQGVPGRGLPRGQNRPKNRCAETFR